MQHYNAIRGLNCRTYTIAVLSVDEFLDIISLPATYEMLREKLENERAICYGKIRLLVKCWLARGDMFAKWRGIAYKLCFPLKQVYDVCADAWRNIISDLKINLHVSLWNVLHIDFKETPIECRNNNSYYIKVLCSLQLFFFHNYILIKRAFQVSWFVFHWHKKIVFNLTYTLILNIPCRYMLHSMDGKMV